jgi:type IV pilus assembly protein PilB
VRYSAQNVPASSAARAPRRAGLAEGSIDPEVVRLVPKHLAERYGVMPIARENHSLSLAMANPDDLLAIDEISKLTGCRVLPVVASREEITRAIVRFYAGEMAADPTEAPALEEEPETTDTVVLDGRQR